MVHLDKLFMVHLDDILVCQAHSDQQMVVTIRYLVPPLQRVII